MRFDKFETGLGWAELVLYYWPRSKETFNLGRSFLSVRRILEDETRVTGELLVVLKDSGFDRSAFLGEAGISVLIWMMQ